MDITDLISFANLIVIGICLSIGYVIKHLIPSDKINRFIPLILCVLGVILSAWIEMDFTPVILLTGLISGLLSVGLYETFKNLIDNGGK